MIQGTGWGDPERMLGYKAGELIEVDAQGTSRACSEGGALDSTSRRSQAEFVCVAYSHARNAGAASNILDSETGASARRGVGHVCASWNGYGNGNQRPTVFVRAARASSISARTADLPASSSDRIFT